MKKVHVAVLLSLFLALSLPSVAQDNLSAGSAAESKSPTQASPISDSAETSKQLSTIIRSGRLNDLRWPNFSDYRTPLEDFYRPYAYALVWIQQGQPTRQALDMIQILQNADTEGLRAEDYDASRWEKRLDQLRAAHTASDEARFEAALTVCTMRYLSNVRMGRVNPRRVGFGLNDSPNKLDLANSMRQRIVNGNDLQSEVVSFEPPFPGYQRLRAALQHYEELAKQDNGEKVFDPLYVVSPGMQYAGMRWLTTLLRLFGDLPEGVTVPPDSKVYEGATVEAVKKFQERHNLEPTGKLDSKTIGEMNVPLNGRLEQMRLTLERYRWLRHTFSQPPVVVNIPEFRLRGFNEQKQVGLTINVNVGDAYYFQTPVFENNIRYIVFRPYWNPPPNILRNEIIPDLKEDPDLEENDLELVTASGQVIRKGKVTSAQLQQLRSGKLQVRQPPGPENALGLVKFVFPNEHHVYLHDTPEGEDMFTGDDRAFSHGCIHVQEPAKLAAWLLRNTPGWDLQRVEYAMHKGRDNISVNLIPPTPVLIVYGTALVEENGEVHFFHDVYGLDALLEKALAKGYPYPR